MSEPTLEERVEACERAVVELIQGLERIEAALAPYFDPEHYVPAKEPQWVSPGEKPN